MSKKRFIQSAFTLLKLTAHCSLLTAVFTGCALFRTSAPPPTSALEEVKGHIQLKGPAPLSAGVAKVDITPPVGTPLAGYAKRKGRPSVGIRDPLYLRVLVLSDGEDLLVLISADLLVFPHPLAQEILDEISREWKVPRRAIILSATHTHSGAGSIAQGFLHEKVFGSYRPAALKGLKGRLFWAVRQAMEHKQPVRWAIALRSSGVLEGMLENRMTPGGPIDPNFTVFGVESLQGQPLGILVSAAAHPTLLDAQDLRFSADYPGEVARLLEAAYPGSVCLFLNGAAGDLRPRDAVGATPDERINRFAAALAEAAVGLMNRMTPQSQGDCAALGRRVNLPPPQLYVGPIPLHPAIGRLMRPTFVYLNLLALNEVVFVPQPAELTTELGMMLRKKMETLKLAPVSVGYANGYLGYAVSPEQYRLKSYETWMTWYGPAFGLSFVNEIQILAGIYSQKKQLSAVSDKD